MHKLNNLSVLLADRVLQMSNSDEFRDTDEMYQTYADSMKIQSELIYPDSNATVYKYDGDYDDAMETIQTILENICGKVVVDANINSINDVIMATIITKESNNA